MKREPPRAAAALDGSLGNIRRRATPIAAIVVIALATGGGGLYWEFRASPQPRWNVVLITFDTMRADHLSCYGYKHIKTPAIDELAREGIRYSRCYSPAPLTLPTHASIMTGLYPFYHGIRVNGEGTLNGNAWTLAETLGLEGYQTGAVVGAYVLHSKFGLSQGFDFYDEDFSAGSAHSMFFYVERDAETVTNAALGWLERLDDRPFFLWVHYFDPHAPYEPPDFQPATATATPYDSEIVYADAQLGRLLDRVRELEHAGGRETLIVFTADHGEALWSHGEPTHGLFVYNDTLHVPLIVRLPAASTAHAVIDTPVSLVDVYPAVLHWLGMPVRHDTHGHVLPVSVETEAASPGTSRALYFETRMPYRTYGWSPLEGVLVGDDKYIAAPTPELYDLSADPFETSNLYLKTDARVMSLERELRALKSARLDTAPLALSRLEPDDESVRKLEALGYVGGNLPGQPSAESLADPKEMAELHRKIDQARLAIETDNFRDAVVLLQSVMDVDPSNARVLQLYLHLLTKREVRPEVARVLRQQMAARLPPPFDALVPLHLGVTALQNGELAEAENLLKQALQARPDDAQANYYLGQALAAQQRAADVVLTYLRRAHQLDPADRTYALALGRCLEELEKYGEAADVYAGLLDRNPDDADALNNCAWVSYRLRQRRESALRYARRAVALQPDDPRFRDTLGCVLLWGGRAEDAARHLRRAVEVAPTYAIAYYHLGRATEALGDRAGALIALRKAVELAEESSPPWLGDARQRLARLGEP